MLKETGFDLWADGYDKSVGLTDENNAYPFAGYRQILGEIYARVLGAEARTVLDVGFGTGTLSARLYEQGCRIYGQDFSERMLTLAKEKIPGAKLYLGDFSQGLVPQLRKTRYDAIVATYSLHHLTDEQKVPFLKELLPLLNDGGHLFIGDVAFETRAQLEQCKAQAGNAWDADELYFVAEELRKDFPTLQFEPVSFCAGILSLEK